MAFPRLFIIPMSLLLCTGCSALRPHRGDPAAGIVPDAFSQSTADAPAAQPWWEDFNSSDLPRLMQQAFSGNLTLRRAEARLRQSEALAVKAGAARFPEITGSGEAGYTETRTSAATAQGEESMQTLSTENYGLALAASYELDLWGRIHATRAAARSTAEASLSDLQTAAVTLSGQVADTWLQMLRQTAQLALLNRQLDANRTYLDLLKLRQRKGLAAALDVYQQQQIVQGTRALIPQSQAQLTALKHQLAVLLGRPPRTALHLEEDTLPPLPPLPRTGLPAQLLIHRPDIQAALRRLESADWNVAAARADRLPALRLTGRTAYSAEHLDDLFDNWMWNLAGGLTAPLIDGGRRRAEVERTRALSDERLAAYRQTVLTALQEVEDALSNEIHLKAYLGATQQELSYARHALQEAEQRYRKGLSDYLPVLTALASTQRLERNVLSARQELLSNRVALYRALGGSRLPEEPHFKNTPDASLPKGI